MSNNRIKDPNSKHYFDEISGEEVDETLESLSGKNTPVTIWYKGKESESQEFVLKEYIPGTKVLKLEYQASFLKKMTGSSLVDEPIFVKVINQNITVFSTSILRRDEKGNYSLTLNQAVYIGQQRSNYRLNASDRIKIKITIGPINLNGIDVSAGGALVMISDEQLAKFPEGQEFKNCTLSFMNQNYFIDKLKVAKHIPNLDSLGQPTGKTKLGISFVDVNKDIEEKLVLDINNEARIEEIRKSNRK